MHCADGDYKDAGLSNFARKSAYRDGQFSDVKTTDWFSGNVRTAVEFGLMNGTGSSSFSPDGNISIAETLALASRIHHIYNGGDGVFTQGSPWYQAYVDYAVENGMVRAGSYPDLSAPATRAQFAVILSKALPASELNQINTVEDQTIPDVTSTEAYSAAVYQLYRAGILVGSDASGTFYPNSTIGRSSVAAIASRMVDKTLRKPITLSRVTLYSLDGRTTSVAPSEVEAHLAVGWYYTPMTVLYGADGSTLPIPVSEVDAYTALGWSARPRPLPLPPSPPTRTSPTSPTSARSWARAFTGPPTASMPMISTISPPPGMRTTSWSSITKP